MNPIGLHPRCRCPRRRGAMLLVAIILFGLVALLVAVIARYALHDLHAQRQSEVDGQARTLALSAKQWCQIHWRNLEVDQPRTLPTDDLVPDGYQASITLQRSANDGEDQVLCAVRVARGQTRAQLDVIWPTDTLTPAATPPADPNSQSP